MMPFSWIQQGIIEELGVGVGDINMKLIYKSSPVRQKTICFIQMDFLMYFNRDHLILFSGWYIKGSCSHMFCMKNSDCGQGVAW